MNAVYHSHTLEHMDRNLPEPSRDPALLFTKECLRVLKPGGVLRIVVPNLEFHVRNYLRHLEMSVENVELGFEYDQSVFHFLGQAVIKEASGTAKQRPMLRRIENMLLGDARKRGNTHQWEYDRINLSALLLRAGFSSARIVDYRTSGIPHWREIGLDSRDDGSEYKPNSLYAEGIK